VLRRNVNRNSEPLPVVSVMPPSGVVVAARPQQVELEAGKEVTATLQVDRKNCKNVIATGSSLSSR
jgi:hypothetical protein